MWIAILVAVASLVGSGILADVRGPRIAVLRLVASVSGALSSVVAAVLIFGSGPWEPVPEVATPRTRGGLFILAFKFFHAIGPHWTALAFALLGVLFARVALADWQAVRAAR